MLFNDRIKDCDLEFIGHDGLHYKLVDNKFCIIEHKVYAKDYEDELIKLNKLFRNYNYPYELYQKKIIKAIKIDIIEDDFYYNKSRYLYNFCGWEILCFKKAKND